jgi:anaerobic ribonucleoside-triphosphate reductase activating protein
VRYCTPINLASWFEDVTLFGGEPMLQAKGLSEIAKYCKTNGLSVMVFTGYNLADLLEERISCVDELAGYIDILVDGYFDTYHRETQRNWVGSTNQKFHFLTERYTNGIEFEEQCSHGFELRIRTDGILQSNGFPLKSLQLKILP